MLDIKLAQKFIEKITKVTDYNVNIMNEKGYIIASRDPRRIGSFHEIAYDVITRNKEIIEVEDDHTYLGVSAGINMGILYEGKCVGVVGVTGKPEQIREIALIIQMAMETMLSYEMQRELSYRHRDAKNRFMDALLSDVESDAGSLKALGEKLGYDEKIIRIPVLCTFSENGLAEGMLERIKMSGSHSKQDISFVTDKQQILVFKTMAGQTDYLFPEYRFLLGEYLSPMLKEVREKGKRCKIYVGTFQNAFRNYRQAYLHCEWLESNRKSDETGIFFYDFLDEYFHSAVPLVEFYRIFNVFKELPDEMKHNVVETVGSLKRHTYNMVASSQELCLHKNTLAFRLEKIRTLFNSNPMKNYKDRCFLEYLQYYLQNLDEK